MYQSDPGASPNGTGANGTGAHSEHEHENGFLGELAHAMQIAAEREHERAAAELDTAVKAHLERVHTRAAAESGELRRMAEVDVDEIHEWSKAEITRIREETARRISVRGNQLDDYLVRHAALTDDEIAQLETSVSEYQTMLDGYFARLATEPNPSEIARLADEMPAPPDLGKIGGEARATALAAVAAETDGHAPVPVMDPAATAGAHAEAQTDDGKPPAAKPVTTSAQRSLWQSIAMWASPSEPDEAKPKESEAIGSGGPTAQG